MIAYQSIRKMLEERRSELRQRLSCIERDIRHEEKPLDQDFAEQAVERENEEVLNALGGSVHQELQAINQAIYRLDRGEYGTCGACGEEIAMDRLQVLPYSNLCIQCAVKQEQMGA
ncbi:MAG: TraR/DksA family transcriptional regulator [Candidatus Polarisedimenticolaceae bacterium]|nr:TraR/DksA family transcriptional regulator [Candidatus Polarisedimenticolaceae bacterium]